MKNDFLRPVFLCASTLLLALCLPAQEPPVGGPDRPQGGGFEPGPPRGRGFGGPGGPERKLVGRFDKDGNKRLDAAERKAARQAIAKEREEGGGREPGGRRRGPPGGMAGRGAANEGRPGPKVDPKDVDRHPDRPLFDPGIIRTLFLTFEDPDWEAELADFYNSDVEVPARVEVDGKTLEGVGVHFRGASSFFTVPAGSKRSLNLSFDFGDEKQRLYGAKTLNLLNCHEDESFMRTVLFLDIARRYIPAPKANFVRVVINGESWGIYAAAEQFNRDFVAENFDAGKGARWKTKGSPMGQAGLDYRGDDRASYESIYTLSSKKDPAAWEALIKLCKTLSETPVDELEAALEPMLDIEGALRFLALEIVFVNADGYWIRSSDYDLYRDMNGRFHIIPHDANETFSSGGGMGPMRGRGRFGPDGPRGGPPPEGGPGEDRPEGGPPAGGPPPFARAGAGRDVDPLVGMDDIRKPLRSRLLAVPSLRKRYLELVRSMAEKWLDWENLGPLVQAQRQLIEADIEKDTRKLSSTEAFKEATSDVRPQEPAGDAQEPRGRVAPSLRAFAEKRRAYLLAHPEIVKLKL